MNMVRGQDPLRIFSAFARRDLTQDGNCDGEIQKAANFKGGVAMLVSLASGTSKTSCMVSSLFDWCVWLCLRMYLK